MSNFLTRIKAALRCLKSKNRTFIIRFTNDDDFKNCISSINYGVKIESLDKGIKSSLCLKVICEVANKMNYENLRDVVKTQYEDTLNLMQQDANLEELNEILNCK